MKDIKVFSFYTMEFSDNTIKSVIGKNGKETQFSHTFYKSNQEYLDTFENINSFVKDKKEKSKSNNVIINLEDFTITFTNEEEQSEEMLQEDLKMAIRILKNEITKNNPQVQKQKALLIKYTNDIKTLKDLLSEGMDFQKEIEELELQVLEVKETIEKLLTQED